MKLMSNCCHALVVSLIAAFAVPVHAELPPGSYETLKKEAKEVLHVDIVKVTRVGDVKSDDPQVTYRCEARVTKVDRSASGYQAGKMIQFDTWYVDPNAKQGFAGPAIPPMMHVGWRGRVFLNPPEPDPDDKASADVLRLAAYGRSFEPERKSVRQPRQKQRPRFRFFRQR